jgi:queuine tRNA-ribosyltransferase
MKGVFFPDGTIGVVRGVDSVDLREAGVEGLVVSTFHLLVHGVKSNLHELMNWDRTILSDSGGFQVFSLLRNSPKSGKITDKGFSFNWNGQKINLTPEESIRQQLRLGSDILICLDQCTDPEEGYEFQKRAVEITIKWARRCKEEFGKQTISGKNKPKLFAVIQGGSFKDLRKFCAEELLKIGFDGYCYGGWPVDKRSVLLEEILEYTAKLMPDDKPKYALGVGKPEDIIKCYSMGYRIFDCVIPTREARHKRFYLFKKSSGLEYETINLNTKFTKDTKPISKSCDCHTCQNFSRAYLHHLFKIGDTAVYRLATIHNLRFYTMLMERIEG